jgi:hypothetical protein
VALEFPQARLSALQEVAVHLVDTRKIGRDPAGLSRDLLLGFYDVCERWGLDGVLDALGAADRFTLADDPERRAALVRELEKTFDFADAGPRNAKPKQMVDSVVAALGLTPVEAPDRWIALPDRVRGEVIAALASVADVELALPRIRDAIIADARARCDASHHDAFTKIANVLDERGMKMTRQLKIPLHAVQAVEHALNEARNAFVERVAGAAIDRAKDVLARTDATAAARIDEPVTLRVTPREVAILRVQDPRITKAPAQVVQTLVDAISELAHLTWQPAERTARTYSAKATFAVGELIEHPKFGRGNVVAVSGQKIDVEFADGKLTLVHAK